MNRLIGTKVSQFILLIILTIACFIYGVEVFDKFDGQLFSHYIIRISDKSINIS